MISEGVNWDSSTPWILDGKEVFDFDMEPVARCATKNIAELVAAAPAVVGLLNEMLSAYTAGRIVGESQLWAMAQHALRQCGTNSFRHTRVPERRGHEDTPFSEVSFACRLPRVPHRRGDYGNSDYYELECELRAAANAHRFMSNMAPNADPDGVWRTGITMMAMALGILTNVYDTGDVMTEPEPPADPSNALF